MEILAGFFILVLLVFVVLIVGFFTAVFFTDLPTGTTTRPRKTQPSLTDEGDYHSGPEGYSPNTAYPETQYGSWFDEEADWNEEHR